MRKLYTDEKKEEKEAERENGVLLLADASFSRKRVEETFFLSCGAQREDTDHRKTISAVQTKYEIRVSCGRKQAPREDEKERALHTKRKPAEGSLTRRSRVRRRHEERASEGDEEEEEEEEAR